MTRTRLPWILTSVDTTVRCIRDGEQSQVVWRAIIHCHTPAASFWQRLSPERRILRLERPLKFALESAQQCLKEATAKRASMLRPNDRVTLALDEVSGLAPALVTSQGDPVTSSCNAAIALSRRVVHVHALMPPRFWLLLLDTNAVCTAWWGKKAGNIIGLRDSLFVPQ